MNIRRAHVAVAAAALVLGATTAAVVTTGSDGSPKARVVSGAPVTDEVPSRDPLAEGSTDTTLELTLGELDASSTTGSSTVARRTSTTRVGALRPATPTTSTTATTAPSAGCAAVDHDRVAFIDVGRAGEADSSHYLLRVLDMSTGALTQLGVDTSFYPQWSSDGCEVIAADHGRITRFRMDGTKTVVSPAGATDQWASMSPDRKHIAFITGNALHVMNADGSGRTRLAELGTANDEPSWSPDSKTIAFEANANGYQLFTIGVHGADKKQLTSFPKSVEKPAFSPDGKWISFKMTSPDGETGNVPGVWVVRPDGTGLRRATPGPSVDWSWSPDSSTIIETHVNMSNSGAYAGYSLHAVSVDTGAVANLGAPTDTTGPALSPDGKTLVFSGTCEGHTSSLCARRMSTGAIRLLVDYAGTGRPVFAPR